MGRTYKGRWTSTHGVTATEPDEASGQRKLTAEAMIWARHLHGIKPTELSRGLELLATLPANERGEHWPPEVLDFRELCRPKKLKPGEHYAAIDRRYREQKAREAQKLLPRPGQKPPKEAAAEGLAGIRKILRKTI